MENVKYINKNTATISIFGTNFHNDEKIGILIFNVQIKRDKKEKISIT